MDINLKELKRVHMIGIGGVSMSGIAKILQYMGIEVTGSDRDETDITIKLSNTGIPVIKGTNPELVKNVDLVVYTAAIKQDNPELLAAKALGIHCMERAEFLGIITKLYKDTICIAGTHGKTTTTSMVSLCFLEESKINKIMEPTIQVGAKLKQIQGNYHIGTSEHFIIEACEYVESFLHFYPKAEIILNIDNDHLDYFKTFENIKNSFKKFAEILPEGGYLVTNADDKSCLELSEGISKTIKLYTFGIENENANFIAKNIVFDKDGFATFDVYFNNKKYDTFKLSVPGRHNVMNALACIALCEIYNISTESMKKALKEFGGANRRFEYKGELNGAAIYDDYGHHPTEIRATAKAVKCKEFNESWVVFQSHTYSRTYNLLNDFVNALLDFDNIIISDIYAAREQNTYNVHPEDIVNKLREKGKNAIYISKYEDIAEYLKVHVKKDDLVITLGAGPVVKVAEMLVEERTNGDTDIVEMDAVSNKC